MNVKTVAALVGTFSLASLAQGCATAQPQVVASSLKEGGEYGCGVDGDVPPLRAPSDSRTSVAATAANQRGP
jgi:hypothetical protein